tara:strand:- start:32 stop:190 length:159 start_codon:yes stop_codon:yes gene_type:complete
VSSPIIIPIVLLCFLIFVKRSLLLLEKKISGQLPFVHPFDLIFIHTPSRRRD